MTCLWDPGFGDALTTEQNFRFMNPRDCSPLPLCQPACPENLGEGQFLGKASCFLPETIFLANFPDDLCLERKGVPMGADLCV